MKMPKSRPPASLNTGRWRAGAESSQGLGFTLTELLVVMTIITLLAGMLLPVLTAAKGKAVQLDCQGHLKQIGLVLTQYTDDYCGTLMEEVDDNGIKWGERLTREGYLPNAQLLHCPKIAPFPPWLKYHYAYGINGHLTNPFGSPFKLINLNGSSKKILGIDAERYWAAWYAGPTAGVITYLHNRGTNMVFCDGHVASANDVPSKYYYGIDRGDPPQDQKRLWWLHPNDMFW